MTGSDQQVPPIASGGESQHGDVTRPWKLAAFDLMRRETGEVAAAFFDMDLRVLEQNARCRELFEAPDAATVEDFRRSAPTIVSLVGQALQSGAEIENDLLLTGKPCRLVLRPLHDQLGQQIGVALFVRPLVAEGEPAAPAVDHRLRNILDALPTMTLVLDAEGVLVSANSAALMAADLQPTEVIGRPLSQSYWWSWDAHAQERLEAGLALAKGGHPQRYREKIRVGAERYREIMLSIAPLRDSEGAVSEIVTSAEDIDELAAMQERQALLAAELTHRVKNILTIVKALVSRTSRRVLTKEALASSLEGRISSMAATISQLSRAQWTGYDLKELISEQLEACDRDRITLSGPPIQLSPKAAMALALITYELASNALKHGALRGAHKGRLAIQWRVDGKSLLFTWQERCDPPPGAPGEPGFGSTLLRNLAEVDLGAEPRTEFAPDGIRVELEIPIARLVQGAQAYSGLVDQGGGDAIGRLSGRRILVVEESPVIALDLASMLEAAGASVVGPFATIDEALAALKDGKVDIAFLGAELRGVSTLPLAKAIKKRGGALLFAAMEEELPNVQTGFPGAVVLSKPFLEADVLQALASLA